MRVHQIGLAVVVEIGDGEPATKAFLVKVGPGLAGDFTEASLAVAQKEPCLLLEGVAEDFAGVAGDAAVGDAGEVEIAVQVGVEPPPCQKARRFGAAGDQVLN